jgi:hypothetical protein
MPGTCLAAIVVASGLPRLRHSFGYLSGNDVRALEGMNLAEVPDLKDPSINAMDGYYIGTSMAPIEAVTSIPDVSPNKSPDGSPHAGGAGSVSGGSAVGQGK